MGPGQGARQHRQAPRRSRQGRQGSRLEEVVPSLLRPWLGSRPPPVLGNNLLSRPGVRPPAMGNRNEIAQVLSVLFRPRGARPLCDVLHHSEPQRHRLFVHRLEAAIPKRSSSSASTITGPFCRRTRTTCRSSGNTLLFTFWTIIIKTVFGLALALLLNQGVRWFVNGYRVLIYLPVILPTLVRCPDLPFDPQSGLGPSQHLPHRHRSRRAGAVLAHRPATLRSIR